METNLVSKPANNTPYVLAVVVMFVIAVATVLGVLKIRPTTDPLVVIGAIFAAFSPTTAGILAFIKSQETHVAVNSRMDAWMEATKAEAHRAGQDDAIAAARGVPPGPAAVTPVPTVVESPKQEPKA